MKRSILIVVLFLLPVLLFGQAKIYTKKTKLADFPQKTTKVVLSGNMFLDGVIRDEVASCWHLSSFEFCQAADYEKLKADNNFYFLRLVKDSDLLYLRLEKGGKENDASSLKRPFEIITVPFASAEDTKPEELVYISAYLDIIQQFTDGAMSSDSKAYSSLLLSGTGKLKGKTIYTDSASCIRSFEACEPDAAVAVSVAPHSGRIGAPNWLYVISCDTHSLLQVRRRTISAKRPSGFTASELAKFNATSSR